ncbi:MAG: GMC family oxidoreductase N-terminal domain-containing protein [Desulfobacteraceae bacterium]|jgi:choline dehydrogenase-like flavoprotein|nr:GMC family oxidoreductase N-terminal domain-containing protein [Desulfobacteraceae bacterium]
MYGLMPKSADVVVVGSGPGGASVARALSRAGRRVLVLEQGRDHRGKWYYGTYPGALCYSEKMALLFTEEGLNIIAPRMVGGATGMYTGSAAMPPEWLAQRYGIDLKADAERIAAELGVAPLPADLAGAASGRIAAAAAALGQEWFAQPKFMIPGRCADRGTRFDCGAKCMLGCRCGAKWHAAEWIDEAVFHGTRLATGARVAQVLCNGRRVAGVRGWRNGLPFTVWADTVVLSSGGLGSARIMQHSGMNAAGVGMAMDTTTMVYGFGPHSGNGLEPPMTYSFENPRDGYMLSTLTDPWLLYPLAAVRVGPGPLLDWRRWCRGLGIMIKLKDDISGGIYPDGRIRKPMTAADRERLDLAAGVCRRILLEAGAGAASIFVRPLIGTHPSATVRIGEMLDENLMTEIEGLYVCDASVFPESLDRPTVLTILSLGERLSRHLAGQEALGNANPPSSGGSDAAHGRKP